MFLIGQHRLYVSVWKSVCWSHTDCVHYRYQQFLSLQVLPDGLWQPPGPVSVRGEHGHDLVSRQDAGCCPGDMSSPDVPHTPPSYHMEKDTPREHLIQRVFNVHWSTDTFQASHWERDSLRHLRKQRCCPFREKNRRWEEHSYVMEEFWSKIYETGQ